MKTIMITSTTTTRITSTTTTTPTTPITITRMMTTRTAAASAPRDRERSRCHRSNGSAITEVDGKLGPGPARGTLAATSSRTEAGTATLQGTYCRGGHISTGTEWPPCAGALSGSEGHAGPSGHFRQGRYGASKSQVSRVAPLQGLKNALQMLFKQIEELRPTRTGVGLRSGLSLSVWGFQAA
jgi:hypothetical protein